MELMTKFITGSLLTPLTEKKSFILPGRGKSSQGTESLGKAKSDECGLLVDLMKVVFLIVESILVTEVRWT